MHLGQILNCLLMNVPVIILGYFVLLVVNSEYRNIKRSNCKSGLVTAHHAILEEAPKHPPPYKQFENEADN